MLTLLIDNYDSFTWNLFQLLAEENGAEPFVVRNDEASWEELAQLDFDNVVLSPGPGRPERERDFGVCAEAIRHCEAPLLGVCLGHQGLGWVHGGRVVPSLEPLHGRVRTVEHAGAPLFAGIPARFEATRYHSLCLEHPLPPELEQIAWDDDGVPMAVAHRTRPQWGVQFHPESVATPQGRQLLANFGALSEGSKVREPSAGRVDLVRHRRTNSTRPRLSWRRLDGLPDPGRVFGALFGASRSAFWLDSARQDAGARFSFMGDASGPLAATVTYDVSVGEVTTERGGEAEVTKESIFDYLQRELERLRPATVPDLPFDFGCGFAGYLGYELKADCGANNAHASKHPDGAFILADRLLAFDHDEGCVYLLCLHETDGASAADEWLTTTATRLEAMSDGAPHLHRSHAEYLDAIEQCKDLLQAGESYEICLTNELSTQLAGVDPLSLYMELRRVNPAPFASYLRFGDLAVLSSSPERFLRVDPDGGAEAKPIKGTAPRGAAPEEDALLAERLRTNEKDRAENLMIVDLLRNDLGSVCAVGSVEVPALMEVESYETVHQLVSTVRGRLRPGAGPVDAVRACFPPGSMTGAPKLRTLEILDRLEGRARGIYSGAIGWFGLGGGCDLSVTIRTIVLDRREGGDRGAWQAAVGAGGAIVLQSEPDREYGEMLLKAAAPLRALRLELDPACDAGSGSAPISLTLPRRAAPAPLPASAHDLKS
ncbi:MAG TPA: aminodeoxychorismate synthase component I [Solirubrobacterales bacterium]|nr:aminodeoxychorismate synthase component I [Solirubrobacterales bacterium]